MRPSSPGSVPLRTRSRSPSRPQWTSDSQPVIGVLKGSCLFVERWDTDKAQAPSAPANSVEDVSDDDVLAEAKSGAMKVSWRWASERVVT